MAVTLSYEATLARVKVSATVDPTVAYASVERTVDDIRWTTVRGGAALTPAAGAVAVDDYEFPPGVAATYRVRGYSPVDVLLSTETAVITAVIERVWLKSVARPYLNTEVVVFDYSEVSRKSRATVFQVEGRTLPVVVSSVRSSRAWDLRVRTQDPAAARALDLLLAGGDILYVQVPAGWDVPGGYVSVGDVAHKRVSRLRDDLRELWTLPMLEAAAPGPDVVGYAATWAGLLADFGSWTAVAAAFPTWADVMEYVADPETVIVP